MGCKCLEYAVYLVEIYPTVCTSPLGSTHSYLQFPLSLPTLHRHLLKHTPSTCSAYLITRTSSWKAWSTFILILADASMYVTLSCLANCCPSSCVTWNGYSGCVWGTILATPVGLSKPGYMHMVLLHLLESRLTHHKGWTDTTVPHNLKPTSAQLRRMHL